VTLDCNAGKKGMQSSEFCVNGLRFSQAVKIQNSSNKSFVMSTTSSINILM
jgi:hypothetical protein